MKTFKQFCETELTESFWAKTTDYEDSSKNGEDYLNVTGVPGGDVKVLQTLESMLQKSEGEVTDEIVNFVSTALTKVNGSHGSAQRLVSWIRWLNVNKKKLEKMDDVYLSY